jgi:copper chaperone NosL
MKNKLSNISRLLLLLSAIGLVLVLYVPIWRIDLDAPQYPEGLSLSIHAKGLKGNVDIINGLNHYIGMKTLHNEDFIEFTVLPYCIVFFAAAFLVTAIANRRKWLNILFILFVVFGVVAMIDFWRWEYNYGHNLDPNAAIIVPGMAYQPPLIGFKQLLNFGAYSVPDIGGWIFIGAGVLCLACMVIEWKRYKKFKTTFGTAALLLFSSMLLQSCNTAPEAIVTGRDNCYFCKMTITDAKYGAEAITKKGKVYKFDDVHCVVSFLKSGQVKQEEVKDIYLVDFSGDHSLVKAGESFLLQGGDIHGPMNGNVIAFKTKDSLKEQTLKLNASVTTWNDVIK